MKIRLLFFGGIAMFSITCFITLSSCKKNRKLIGSTTTRNLRVDTYNYSDCNLDCNSSLTFVAINDSDFDVKANFKLVYEFPEKDSIQLKQILLKPHDSTNVACGCADKPVNKNDWMLVLTILSAEQCNL
ncbi:hypothetical protein QWZ08_04420 [Ferruginibacter paludis]|uniref:hypothetical protein n=1 Tax=Ferruginibacter paludis TaxID=1310417 RepID=UPI0025B60F8A|nr:hypothetical protein [Ferruginibacter paludis]MDN3654860.1 hypothetical protein [Ferruginibacter paludis]